MDHGTLGSKDADNLYLKRRGTFPWRLELDEQDLRPEHEQKVWPSFAEVQLLGDDSVAARISNYVLLDVRLSGLFLSHLFA